MVEPRLPDIDNPAPEVSNIGSQHQTIRESFRTALTGLTDYAQYTDVVYVPSDKLRQLASLGAVLIGDHEQIEKTNKIDQKSGVVSYETARFEIDRTVNDRRRQVGSNPGLYEVPFAFYSFFDADNFKKVNEALTNPVADLTIQDMGKSLNQSMQKTRMGDFPMRHGGDEFGVWFGDLFGDPAKVEETTTTHFHRMFEILTKLEDDVNRDLHLNSERRGISKEALEKLGRLTFSLGFIYPSLKDIDQYKQGNDYIPDHFVIFKMANEQEVLAKADRTTSTIATNGVVYAIDGRRVA